MKLKSMSADQLLKKAKRGFNTKHCLCHLANRIESGPAKSCIPKKKLRAAGLLPPVNQ